jgi:subtilisin family serine protease
MAEIRAAFARTMAFRCGVWSALGTVLVACGGGGGSSASPTPPVVSATASVSQGQAPLAVTFDASKSTDPQGYALTYAWTFGDGSTGSGATVSHTFQNHGTYSATVAVSDGHNTTTSSPIGVTVTPAPPTVQPTAFSVNVLGVAPTSTTATVSASDREKLQLTYSLASPPTAGTATINARSGAIAYSVAGYASAATDSFTVKVANLGASSTGTVTVALNSDPLLGNQWHIQNTGQNAFSTTLPVAGNDMDVAGAWTAGYTGQGIKVGVVDTGLQAAHEDLAANVDLMHSINFLTGTNDPTPTTAGFDHGTAVSGIIGAVAFNGKGGRGVAYNATLRGYNWVATGAGSLANLATALGGSALSADNDLFNASFGPVTNAIPTFSGAYQSITTTTLGLRGGLGATIVNAAGNDFEDFELASSPLCVVAQQYAVSCGDPASDERRGGNAPLIVGALNAEGVHASYSNTGSALWISAPGGEFGFNSSVLPGSLVSTLSDPTNELMPAIITTSISGCANAINPLDQPSPVPLNPLDDLGANPLAASCQYTASMNGTSAATPNVAGVVALMLQANPKLSIRDIKYILAKTAKHVDPNFAGITSTSVVTGSTVTLEQGWVTNAAGFTFSNRYGFGGVDAAAAVAAATSYSSYLPAVQTVTYEVTAAAPATITPASTVGGDLTYAATASWTTVEDVIVLINIDATFALPCNQIELTSPAGTKSILLHAANGFTNTAVINSRFESNAFYGEPMNGTWTLRFLNFCSASEAPTVLSTTQPQILAIVGH